MFLSQRISTVFVLLALVVPLSGNNPYKLKNGAEETGMGGICLTLPGFWQYFHNQALLAYNDAYAASVNYDNRFNIKELGTRSAAITIPAGNTSLGVVYSNYGYKDFRRISTGLAAGMRLGDCLSAGLQIDYFSERTYGEYESYQTITFELGIAYNITEDVRIGMHIFNPLPKSILELNIPSAISTGIGANISEGLFLAAEITLITDNDIQLRTGFDYEIVKNLHLRTGYSTLNNSFSLGLGYKIRPVAIDIAFASHESLGLTSAISLTFSF